MRLEFDSQLWSGVGIYGRYTFSALRVPSLLVVESRVRGSVIVKKVLAVGNLGGVDFAQIALALDWPGMYIPVN